MSKSTYLKKNTCSSKYGLSGGINLSNQCQCDIINGPIDTCQANPCTECRRKCEQYVDRWVKPSPQSLLAASSLLELVDLVLKYGENGGGRFACLELYSERMRDKILLCLYFIRLEGLFKNPIKAGRRCCR